VVSTALTAQAGIFQFDISPSGTSAAIGLSGANEATPTGSSATGNETGLGISYDSDSNLLTLNFAYGSSFGFVDLVGNYSDSHIHLGAVGVSGGVIHPLGSRHTPSGTKSGSYSGTITYTELQEADLLNGLHYINIHSSAHGGGEIRGQLTPVPEPHEYAIATGLALIGFAAYRNRSKRIVPAGACRLASPRLAGKE
jgi:hypothetical protein